MLTLKIENKKVEEIFLNEFHSNKEKFFEFIEKSFINAQQQPSKLDDLSHLSSQVEAGFNSPLSSKSHKEIFQELKTKYA